MTGAPSGWWVCGMRTTTLPRLRPVSASRWAAPMSSRSTVVRHAERDFTVLTVPDGSTAEVFGSTSSYNQHLTSPVAGFSVTDLNEALGELLQAGVEIVLPSAEATPARGCTSVPR